MKKLYRNRFTFYKGSSFKKETRNSLFYITTTTCRYSYKIIRSNTISLVEKQTFGMSTTSSLKESIRETIIQ